MRRFAKMIPQEISLTQEGANRRVIATYKSRNKASEENVVKGGPGVKPQAAEEVGSAHGQANKASSKAQKATETAQDSNSRSLHMAASKAHFEAAKVHTAAGNTAMAKKHQLAAADHAEEALDESNKSCENMNIQEAIQNTPADIVEQLSEVTKSAKADGKSYTPQAASVMKAVGRMLAPFSDELSLDDLKTIGMAAGFEGTTESSSKSVNKGKPEEDDTEAGAEDLGRAEDFEDADDDDDADAEQEMIDGVDPEDDEEEEGEEPKVLKKSVQIEDIALKAKKDDTGADDEAESVDDPAGDDDKSEPKKAVAWGQPKGTKAKEKKVAKSATSGSGASEEQYHDIRKSFERQKLENEQLREAIAKTRADLDEERGYRALENIKKSVREDYAHLNVDVDSLAPVLKSLKEAKDNALYEQLTATLKAADAQVKAAQDAGGLFQAVGKSSSRSAAAGAGSSWADKIDARVEEEFKKNAKGRVKSQVYDAFTATDEGREMLANHRAEMAQERGY